MVKSIIPLACALCVQFPVDPQLVSSFYPSLARLFEPSIGKMMHLTCFSSSSSMCRNTEVAQWKSNYFQEKAHSHTSDSILSLSFTIPFYSFSLFLPSYFFSFFSIKSYTSIYAPIRPNNYLPGHWRQAAQVC